MASTRTSTFIQHLRRVALLGDGAGLTDGQLLSYFIERQDDAAFAALVRRHGPMVWGVCRRVLRNVHDAEDAFQATFLVLARKAASVLPREKVANWLYGVAWTTAHRAKVTAAKRRVRERQVTDMPEPAARPADLWCDLQPLLDAELSRLPDKYRFPIVLCDLEGKSRKEAARQLGVPDGTVAGRLARARVMLAKRLARHGLAISGGVLATLLAQNAASARMPMSMVSSTVQAARLIAAGQAAAAGVVSAQVVALMEGVLQGMLLTKIRTVLGIMLVTGVLGLGVALGAHGPATDKQTDAKKPVSPPAADKAQAIPIAPPPFRLRKSGDKEKLYQLDCMVVVMEPDGNHNTCRWRLVAPERQEGCVSTGPGFSLPRDEGDAKSMEETIGLGLLARLKVIPLKNGLVRLDAKVEMNKLDETDKNNTKIRGTYVRSVSNVKMSQEVKLVIEKDDWGEPRIWACIKVDTIQPAPAAGKVLSNPPIPEPQARPQAGPTKP